MFHIYVVVAVTVGFNQVNYTVNEEDGSVTLSVALLSGILERNITVPFFTSSGTATQEGTYYHLICNLTHDKVFRIFGEHWHVIAHIIVI